MAAVVFSAWNAQKSALIRELIEKTTDICLRRWWEDVTHQDTLPNIWCTLWMDCDTGNIVSGRIMQLGQESTSSVGMEKVGLQTCLEEILTAGVPVTAVTTDHSPSVIGLMKTKFSHINHQHDLWHISKSIKKKLLALSKKKELACIADWVRSIINHLYYSAQNCQQDSGLLIEMWLSILKHIIGVHSWHADHRHKRLLSRTHADEDGELQEQGGLEIAYLHQTLEAYRAIEKVLTNPQLLTAIRRCSLALSTDYLEQGWPTCGPFSLMLQPSTPAISYTSVRPFLW